MKKKSIVAWIALTGLLAGCAPVMVGGVVAGSASVVTDRRSTGSQVSDNVLERRVAWEITQHIPMADQHITVTSYNGKVLLTGEVRTEQQKETAGTIAKASLDVTSVVNELAVQTPVEISQRLKDSTLATSVRSRIVATKGASLNQMSVVVDRGIVYLMGLVTEEEGNTAASVAAATQGVVQVVKVFEYQTQEQIQKRMENLNVTPASGEAK